jgi:porin
MRLITIMLAVATAATVSVSSGLAPAATEATPSPADFKLTLDPPPGSSDSTSSSTATEEFVPHSSADIGLSLEEGRTQPDGIFPYGPVSLIYPYWKSAAASLHDKLGLDIGMETDLVFQAATNGPGDRDAGGGYWALFGKWRLLGTPDGANNGYLKFKADYQWQIGSQAPRALGGQIDSLWRTTKGFGENSPSFVQLYWEQHFLNKTFVLVAGKIDPTNYYATNLWSDDKQFFMNAAFSTTPAIAMPGSGLGVNAKYTPCSWLYMTAGFQDQQGNANNTSTSIDTFFKDFDLFSAMEIGLTPKIPGLGQGNYRFTAWHADAVPSKEKPSDEGFALSLDQAVTPNVIPFARYEYDKGDLTGIRQLLTGGIGFHGAFLSKQDVCGVAVAWGQPAKTNLFEQYTAEAFYRVQLSPANQLSLGYQFVVDPSLAPQEEIVGVFWVRFRILF